MSVARRMQLDLLQYDREYSPVHDLKDGFKKEFIRRLARKHAREMITLKRRLHIGRKRLNKMLHLGRYTCHSQQAK